MSDVMVVPRWKKMCWRCRMGGLGMGVGSDGWDGGGVWAVR